MHIIIVDLDHRNIIIITIIIAKFDSLHPVPTVSRDATG